MSLSTTHHVRPIRMCSCGSTEIELFQQSGLRLRCAECKDVVPPMDGRWAQDEALAYREWNLRHQRMPIINAGTESIVEPVPSTNSLVNICNCGCEEFEYWFDNGHNLSCDDCTMEVHNSVSVKRLAAEWNEANPNLSTGKSVKDFE